jgi:DNA-binding transcriptional MocR family regulator
VGSGVSAAYLIPDFHNPTGALMPEGQRAEIAAAMTRAGVIPIVDETLVETALDEPDQMPHPFAVHAPSTVTIGSASKTYWGGLRVGWIRTDPSLLDRLVEARVSLDPSTAVAEQLVLLHLMRETAGLVAEHRVSIRQARDVLVEAVRAELPEVRCLVPRGGLSLWLKLPHATATEVAVAAEDEGLLVAAGPQFAARGGHGRWLRVPYVREPDVLVEAVARLRRAIDRVSSEPGRRPVPKPEAHRRIGPLVA